MAQHVRFPLNRLHSCSPVLLSLISSLILSNKREPSFALLNTELNLFLLELKPSFVPCTAFPRNRARQNLQMPLKFPQLCVPSSESSRHIRILHPPFVFFDLCSSPNTHSPHQYVFYVKSSQQTSCNSRHCCEKLRRLSPSFDLGQCPSRTSCESTTLPILLPIDS